MQKVVSGATLLAAAPFAQEAASYGHNEERGVPGDTTIGCQLFHQNL